MKPVHRLLWPIVGALGLTTVAGADVPPGEISAQVDALFAEAWQQARVTPAPVADDAAFLRRVTLDLTGILPKVGEVRALLADERADKRARRIAELLSRPRHATHLANVWRDVLLPRNVPQSASRGLVNWLQTQFRDNVPYDAIVQEILLAQGSLVQSAPVVYYAALDTRPEQLAASTSRVFLGVQIRCAQCHDHPFTKWTQRDFWSYAAFFAQVQGPSQMGGPAQLQDVSSGEVRLPTTKATVAPQFLDGDPVSAATAEPRRALLARWITDTGNPYFARATVNRVWSIMFGRGLVHPVDDQGDHNPPTHPEVLDLLAEDFLAHGFDLRRVFQIIAQTQLYQRSSQPTPGDDDPLRNYTSMPVRSLSAKQIYDCIVQAARRREPLDPRAAGLIEERAAFLAQVEAPTQQVTEFQGGIPQALALLNGEFVSKLTDPWTSDFVVALVDSPFLTDKQRVETLFLATLSRRPREEELAQSLEWVRTRTKDGDQAQGLSDVLWALLNSSEFLLIQ